ncbi:MAG: GAF domain-containing protein [Candidatus Binatia bacterium]
MHSEQSVGVHRQNEAEIQKQMSRLSALRDITFAISSCLDLPTVLNTLLEQIDLSLSFSSSNVLLLNNKTGELERIACRNIDEAEWKARKVPIGHGRSYMVVERMTPIIVRDLRKDPPVHESEFFRKHGLISSLAIPLIAKGQALGVLWFNTKEEHEFSDEEVDFLSTIAGQAAIAIHNSQLYEQSKRQAVQLEKDIIERKRTEEELKHCRDHLEGMVKEGTAQLAKTNEQLTSELAERRQAEELIQRQIQRLAVLDEITLAVTSTLDLHAVLNVLMEKIDALLPYTAVLISLLNRESGLLERTACRNLNEEEWKGKKLTGISPLAKAVIEAKAPLVVSNVQTDPRTLDPGFYRRHGLVSYLGVPLLFQGEVLGVLVFLTREEYQFTSQEIQFLSTLAGQAAIAIHNSQLFQQVNRRTHELSALHAVTAAASQSLELDAVLQEVIKKITEIFGFAATRIFLFNPEMDELHLRASFEIKPEVWTRVRFFRRGQGNIGRAAETGEPLIFEDIQSDPRYQELSHSRATWRAGFSFFAAFPIKGKTKTMGAIVCIGQNPRRLTPKEIQLITSMLAQIGIAVENASLFEGTKEKAKELAALYSIAKVGNQSLELKTLLRDIMREIRRIFNFDAARIRLLDDDGKDLDILADEGFSREIVPLKRGSARKAIETRQPLLFEDLRNNLRYQRWSVNNLALKEGFQTAFYIPIRAKDKALGLIGCFSKSVHHFSPYEVELIHSIMDHLGTAVENARLYEVVQRSREELRTLAKRVQVAQEEARSRLARQLHDELGQPLMALKMELAAASDRLAKNRKVREKTTKPCFDLVDAMVQTVRNIGMALRPAVLDDLGLAEAIEWQAEDFHRRTGIQCKVTSKARRNSLDPERSVAVFRIFQEILSNIARHAGSNRVKVEWKQVSNNMLLRVSDNGKGIKPRALTSNKSLGIIGMRERALLCRGELDISGILGKGTTVSLRIPAH